MIPNMTACTTFEDQQSPLSTNLHIHYLEDHDANYATDLYDKGFSIVPLCQDCSLPINFLSHLYSVRLYKCDLEWYLPRRNFGVLTGQISKDLFTVRCKNEQTVKILKEQLNLKSSWISHSHEGFDMWFLSGFGTVRSKKYHNSDTDRIQIIGDRNLIILPGSVSPEGELSYWYEKEGEFPPSIDKNTLLLIFDQVQVIRKNDLRAIKEQKIDCTFPLSETEEYRVAAEHFDWTILGRSTTYKNVYLALITRATLEKSSCFRASIREISTLANVASDTVQRALKNLLSKGLVELIEKSPNGNLYRLTPAVKNYHTTSTDIHSVLVLQTLEPHDVWSWRGLGPVGKHIAEYLLQMTKDGEKKTIEDIVDETKHTKSTVRKRLSQMECIGLAKTDGTYWYVDEKDFDNLDANAEYLQVSGTLARKEHRHYAERQRYAARKLRQII